MMLEEQIEKIYEAMIGMESCCLYGEEIENLFEEGKPCEKLYGEVYDAKFSIAQRLGMVDEDEEVELIINNLLEIGRIQSIAMFRHGQKFGRI